MPRRRSRALTALVAVLVVLASAVGIAGALGSTGATSAAWTNDAQLNVASVSSGTWTVAAAGYTCDAYTAAGVLLPPGTCWVELRYRQDSSWVGVNAWERQFDVKSNANQDVYWQVQLNLADTATYPNVPTYVLNGSSTDVVPVSASCPANNLLRVAGYPNFGQNIVRSGVTQSFTIFGTSSTGWSSGHNLLRDCSGGGASPVYPGTTTTAFSTDVSWDLTNATSSQQACFTATVTTTSPTPVAWKVVLDLSKPPFNGATSGFDVNQGATGYKHQIAYSTPSAGFATITGKTGINDPEDTVVAGQTRLVTVCNTSLPGGVQSPWAYTTTTTQGTWTDTNACQNVTVTGNGTSPFFFKWQVVVDMSAARSRLTAFSAWTPTGNLWQLTVTDLGANRFLFSANTAAELRGTGTFSFSYCAIKN